MPWIAVSPSRCRRARRGRREALPPIAGSPQAHQAQRESRAGAHGVVACRAHGVSNGKDGGSGRIEWTQGPRFELR
jgi:hypothetical protein